ncbi:MAG: hypothetical protein KAS78_06440 [Candidatus Pacebacteria bacterium]|nr:hypothetical protein [Candidatus Paceibacterota bacterium]
MRKEEMIQQKKKIPKEFAFLFFSMIASCIIMYCFAAPLYEDSKIKKLEIGVKKNNIESRELLLSRVMKAEISDEDKISVENIEKIKGLASNRDNYEEYLVNVVEIASGRNVLINDLTVSNYGKVSAKSKVNGNFSSSVISFSASGGFFNFINFLEDIERNIPLIQVESVEIGKEGSKDDFVASSSMLSFSVKINFFHY